MTYVKNTIWFVIIYSILYIYFPSMRALNCRALEVKTFLLPHFSELMEPEFRILMDDFVKKYLAAKPMDISFDEYCDLVDRQPRFLQILDPDFVLDPPSAPSIIGIQHSVAAEHGLELEDVGMCDLATNDGL